MNSLPIIGQEVARIEALGQYGPQEAFSEDVFMPLLELARHLFEVPTAYISLIARDEQNLVMRAGIEIQTTRRDASFCTHTIARGELLVVLDTALDPRFSDNPLVLNDPYLRFYAGMPLIAPSGHPVGTVSIADTRPRVAFNDAERGLLRELAALVLDRMELRRLERARGTGRQTFEDVAASSPDGVISLDRDGVICFWNAAADWLFGHRAEDALGNSINLLIPPGRRAAYQSRLRRFMQRENAGIDGKTIELMARHANGFEFPVELSVALWPGAPAGDGVARYSAVLRNVRERRANEDRLFRLAHRDPLTELPNRAVLRNRVDQMAAAGKPASLLILSLDGLRDFHAGAGQAATDVVLRRVADRLLACVQTDDMVARLGGDTFAILLPGDEEGTRATAVADAAIQAIAEPFILDSATFILGACVGIASAAAAAPNAKDLLLHADIALDQARAEGRNSQRVFSQALRQAVDRTRAHESDLWRAFRHNEFEVFYQPQIRLSGDALVGAEALLRWRHPEHGLLSPAAFMPALERSPLSARVGDWVLRTACAQAAAWHRDGTTEFRIGVNLFSAQFGGGDLAAKTRRALEETGLPAWALELEITENILLRHDEGMVRPLRELRDHGVGIAFDDYGTGYASLSMLKRFPITRLKVDQSFVRGMCQSDEDTAIVHAILYLGRSFGLAVIAEGVERQEQADRLRSEGCQEAQGYLFGRPMPAAQFSEMMRKARDGTQGPPSQPQPTRERGGAGLTRLRATAAANRH